MSVKHTEGPWYFDGHGTIWRRPPSDLYENGGEVAGDRPIATVHIGWRRDGENGYPVEANGRLIAAAPELLEALTEIVAAADGDGWKQLDPSFAAARAAIAKARGETC